MILLISPATQASDHGNSVTTQRWARIITDLGHQVRTSDHYPGGGYSALVALHARKSAGDVRAFHADNPGAPVVLALTGTDLYPSLDRSGVDPAVLRIADRLVVLQSHAVRQLDDDLQARARVIVQSMRRIHRLPRREDIFEVAVLAHLRPVKDPLRAAAATRLLPAGSRILITHAGAPLEADLAEQARAETATNPRYDWLGDQPRHAALELLAHSRLLVLTSRDEGGANVVSEAIAAGVPVLSSDIPGSRGLLGDDYPGYFAVGDTAGLADRLRAAETDPGYYQELAERCAALHGLVEPARERESWAALLAELPLPAVA